MILFTNIELKYPKNGETQEEIEKKVLRELTAEDIEEEDGEWQTVVGEAVLDLYDNLLYYEHDGYTYVERLAEGTIVKTLHDIENIKELYHQKYSQEQPDEDDDDSEPITLENIDAIEESMLQSVKDECNAYREALRQE